MMEGNVKKIVSDKGFGFIRAKNGSEFFFHKSAVDRPDHFDEIMEGDPVVFEVGDGPKGPRAEHVRRV
jgi:CspA family cold shock protein